MPRSPAQGDEREGSGGRVAISLNSDALREDYSELALTEIPRRIALADAALAGTPMRPPPQRCLGARNPSHVELLRREAQVGADSRGREPPSTHAPAADGTDRSREAEAEGPMETTAMAGKEQGPRQQMVRELAVEGLQPAHRAAFERVPRHLFVPRFRIPRHDTEDGWELIDGTDPKRYQRWIDVAYSDEALFIQWDETSGAALQFLIHALGHGRDARGRRHPAGPSGPGDRDR